MVGSVKVSNFFKVSFLWNIKLLWQNRGIGYICLGIIVDSGLIVASFIGRKVKVSVIGDRE